MARRQIVHIHIPKTAGTSITQFLKDLVGNRNVAHFSRKDKTKRFSSMSREDLSVFRCIGGHMPYERIMEKAAERTFVFSILRDPGDHFASFYSDIVRRETHPLHEFARERSPFDFLHFAHRENLFSSQTFYLSERKDLNQAIQRIIDKSIHVDTLPNLNRLLKKVARVARREFESLPHANASRRDNSANAEEFRAAVEKCYADDVRLVRFVEEFHAAKQRN